MTEPEDIARLRAQIMEHAAEADRTARELASTPLAPWAAGYHIWAAWWRAVGERIGR